jgi:hypothetical protein
MYLLIDVFAQMVIYVIAIAASSFDSPVYLRLIACSKVLDIGIHICLSRL